MVTRAWHWVCAGGLVTEPIARLGAKVLGVDMSEAGVNVARHHASKDPQLANNPFLRYETCAAGDVARRGETFDAVIALEIIEHVPDITAFLKEVSSLVRPGGVLILSTINRTVASYALAIVVSEYILRMIPVGTHSWSRFVRPDEISDALAVHTSVRTRDVIGIAYNPLFQRFSIMNNTSVFYMLTAVNRLDDGTLQDLPPQTSFQTSV